MNISLHSFFESVSPLQFGYKVFLLYSLAIPRCLKVVPVVWSVNPALKLTVRDQATSYSIQAVLMARSAGMTNRATACVLVRTPMCIV